MVISRCRQRLATGLSLAALVLLSPALLAPPAHAQTGRPRTAAQSRPIELQSPLIAVVSIGKQRVTIFDRTGPIAQSPVSSGIPGHETPQGIFSIIEKKEEHNSNLYNDASMPFMQRITWSGVALHAGVVPGYPASHGCIRLPAAFAEKLFGMTRMNTRVVVVPGETAPDRISHPALFQPKLEEAPAVAAATTPPHPAPPLRTSDGIEAPMMLGARLAKPVAPAATDPIKPETAVLTPLEMARAKKVSLSLQVSETAKAAEQTKLIHKARLADLGRLQRTIGSAEVSVRRAEQVLAASDRQIGQARTEDQIERANVAYMNAVSALATARRTAEETRQGLASINGEIKAAADAVKAAEQRRLAAAAEARTADRLAEPVSVFVSRKTGKLYIRQARQPVAEIPIAITDRHQSIGTHVFTAIATPDGGRTVEWSVISLQAPQSAGLAESEVVEPKAARAARGKPVPPPAPRPQSTPSHVLGAQALERIRFTDEILARITPYVQPGSSLIVSDLGPSIETGPGTDFVVQTRGEAEAIEFIERYARENGLKAPKRP